MGLWNWLFSQKEPKNDTELARKLLDKVYSPKIYGTNNLNITIEEYLPQEKEPRIKFKVKAPTVVYTRTPLGVVTAVTQMLVLSELPFVFIFLLLRDKVITDIEPEEFKRLMSEYKLKFSEVQASFRRELPLNKDYFVAMKLVGTGLFHKKYPTTTIEISATNHEGKEAMRGMITNTAITKQ